MGLFVKKKKETLIYSPIKGKVMEIAKTPDPVFAEKMMGDGVVIFPNDTSLYAPVDGKIKVLFPTKHAIGIETNGGIEVLIHIGIDSVKLNGKGFYPLVKEGDWVSKGDKLMDFDLEMLEKEAVSSAIPVLITNQGKHSLHVYIEKAFVDIEDCILKITE